MRKYNKKNRDKTDSLAKKYLNITVGHKMDIG